nr:BX4 [Aphelandra squarrosa]
MAKVCNQILHTGSSFSMGMQMEGLLWWVLAVALAYIVASFFFNNGKKPKLPPGPKPWPIIGNLNLIGPIPHQSLHDLFQKYGELMHLKFGHFPVVVASTPEMAKQFLKTHDTAFASRPALDAGRLTSYNYTDLTWAPYGPYWRLARKIYVVDVFSAKKLDSDAFHQIRVEERQTFFSLMHSLAGKPVVLRGHLGRAAVITISRMVMGKAYFGEDESCLIGTDGFQELLDEWFFLNGVFSICDWIPWLRFIDPQGYVRRMKNLHKELDRIFDFVVADHEATRMKDTDSCSEKDVVYKMLDMTEEPTLGVALSREHVKALLQNLILGGTDTTPTSVEWILCELMKNPPIVRKAKEELNRAVGRDRWVEESDFPELPYLDAIIKETMRLHPIATFLAPHCAMEDCKVAGYDIPKGATVFINSWSLGRDPDSWDRPLEFLPERFMEKEIDIMGSNFAMLPFGAGRRRCPGYGHALKNIRAIVANLLHGFELKLPNGMKPSDVNMEEEYGLTTHPKEPLALIMEPTLPPHLY